MFPNAIGPSNKKALTNTHPFNSSNLKWFRSFFVEYQMLDNSCSIFPLKTRVSPPVTINHDVRSVKS